jgi:hypothetical protein
MNVTIDLSPEEEARIREKADAEGLEVDQYVRKLIGPSLEAEGPAGTAKPAGTRLLEQLRADGALGIWKDRADTPELAIELRRRAEKRAGAE